MAFTFNKPVYKARDFDKMTEERYIAFQSFINSTMAKLLDENDAKLIAKSDQISTKFFDGVKVTKKELRIIDDAERMLVARLPPNFVESMRNYYRNKYYRNNVHIN